MTPNENANGNDDDIDDDINILIFLSRILERDEIRKNIWGHEWWITLC